MSAQIVNPNKTPYLFRNFSYHGNISLESIVNAERPRFFKTHFPTPFLPDQIWSVIPKVCNFENYNKGCPMQNFPTFCNCQRIALNFSPNFKFKVCQKFKISQAKIIK
jgi:hypothetical protein